MNQTSKWSAGAVLVSVLIVVASWFLLLSPQRSDTAGLKQQKAAQDSTNVATKSDIDVLRALAVQLPAQRAVIAKFKDRVPDNPALPSLVRALTAEAAKAGVQLSTIVPTTPSALTSGATAGTPDSSGLQQIGLTLSVTGDYFAVETFLSRLESLQRVFLVTSLDLATAQGGEATGATGATSNARGDVTASIIGRVFLTGAPVPAVGGTTTTGVTTKSAGAAPAAAVN